MMRMGCGLVRIEHRGHRGVNVEEDLRPFRPRSGGKRVRGAPGSPANPLDPAAGAGSRGRSRALQADSHTDRCRSHRQPCTCHRLSRTRRRRERRSRRRWYPGPEAHPWHVVLAHHEGHAVDHRHIDDSPAASALRVIKCRDHTESEQQTAAPEVTDDVQWGRWRRTCPADLPEKAGQADVIDVVAAELRQRAVLPPSGDARVHQARVHRLTFAGPTPRRSAVPGRKPSTTMSASAAWRSASATPASAFRSTTVAACPGRRWFTFIDPVHRGGTAQRMHLGAMVGEHHAGERPGADAAEFHDLDPAENLQPGRVWRVRVGSHVELASMTVVATKSTNRDRVTPAITIRGLVHNERANALRARSPSWIPSNVLTVLEQRVCPARGPGGDLPTAGDLRAFG